jgi:uncharacterized membrane protein YgaE (UPF0421/DUF939 family)
MATFWGMRVSDNVEVAPAGVAAQGVLSRARGEWLDRFLGSDPGLNRLRMAAQTVITIALTLVVERVFVATLHPMRVPTGPGAPPGAAAANHAHLVIALMIGAVIGMLSTFTVNDATVRGQVITMLLMPVFMVPSLTVGMLLGKHHDASLAWLTLMMGVGTYARRFGPRGFMAGNLLFMGDFFGFFLRSGLRLVDLTWLVAELLVGLAVAVVVRFTLFAPHPERALRRTQRSYAARARRLATLALENFESHGRGERQVHRQLVRLNEAALMIDALLGDPAAVPNGGATAAVLHERLFDLEVALSNVARFAVALSRVPLSDEQRRPVRAALVAVAAGDLGAAREEANVLIGMLNPNAGEEIGAPTVVAHRFAISVRALSEAMTEWLRTGATARGGAGFEPATSLFGGWLPGSSRISADASVEPAPPGEGVVLRNYTRTALQMTLAVALACVLGSLVSRQRFYWAVIATFITFTGANTSGEQVRKALWRVLGTLVGILVGSLLVDLVGQNAYASVAVILAALFVGFYLMRISYAFFVVGITVMVSQLYQDLGEFSENLLRLRLEETALGAGVAVAVVVLVVPLRTHRVIRLALRRELEAVSTLIEQVRDVLVHGRPYEPVRATVRRIDASFQELLATARPVRRTVLGSVDEGTGRLLHHASATRHFARTLALDLPGARAVPPAAWPALEEAFGAMLDSISALTAATTGPTRPYVRSASLFHRAARTGAHGLPAESLLLRDLSLLDGSMAALADVFGIPVHDHDTSALVAAPVRIYL